MAVSLLWVVVAPVYARGLALIARPLIPVLETAPDTRYVVEGGRLLAQRPTWFEKQKRTAPLVWPIWVSTANYGMPLLAALILATPGWRWRRRGRALAVGLEETDRNTKSILNARFNRWFGWSGASDSLWAASIRPLFDPREMGNAERHVAALVRAAPDLACGYRSAFGHAPPDDDETLIVDIGKALAAFQE